MTITELIAELTAIRQTHGDIPVAVQTGRFYPGPVRHIDVGHWTAIDTVNPTAVLTNRREGR